jgi:hypothetical protein
MSQDDDDFAEEHTFDDLEEDSTEWSVWQLLLLINPGDQETALQQFVDYREIVADGAADDTLVLDLISKVIDWRSGFLVEEHDIRSLVQAINELSSRWNLSIDWGGDPDEDEFYEDMDAASLFATAYDCLAGFGYTLWSFEAPTNRVAGWMTLTRDAEPMRELATTLDINLRLGSDVS